MFRCKWQLAAFLNSGIRAVDIDKTLWLSPEKIVYSSLREFDIYSYKGAVIGGDWDRLEKRFEDLDVYVVFKQVFLEGRNWTETVFYKRILDRLSRGEILWGCADENDLRKRCKDLETLYQSIKDGGYRSQPELLRSGQVRDSHAVDDEVIISIGRDGDLLFSDGAHRLAIAKLLGITQIPVKIAVRHRGWMKLRGELLQYASSNMHVTLGGRLYQPLTHPDLLDIPASHKCEDRYCMIKEKMSAKGGRLLDVGANLGYFCHRFEDQGFECYAVENSKEELYFLQKLRRAENKRFKIVAESILEWSQVSEICFDVVLALNVFHHFLKTKESYQKLVTLLQNLKMRELFFEPPSKEEMKGAYRDYSPSEFVEFIMQVSKLKREQLIGEAADGRKLYRLS